MLNARDMLQMWHCRHAMGEIMQKCEVCGREDVEVSLEPTKSQLLQGGLPASMEYRCADCDEQVYAWLNLVLNQHGLD